MFQLVIIQIRINEYNKNSRAEGQKSDNYFTMAENYTSSIWREYCYTVYQLHNDWFYSCINRFFEDSDFFARQRRILQ